MIRRQVHIRTLAKADDDGKIDVCRYRLGVAEMFCGLISAFNWWRRWIFHQSASDRYNHCTKKKRSCYETVSDFKNSLLGTV